MSTHRTFLAIATSVSTLIGVVALEAAGEVNDNGDRRFVRAKCRREQARVLRTEDASACSGNTTRHTAFYGRAGEPSAGLVINGVFDSSITSNANAAAIMAAVNSDIAIYQSSFTDAITVKILYRYANTFPDGSAVPNGAIATSYANLYGAVWASFITSLTTDSKSVMTPKRSRRFRLPHNRQSSGSPRRRVGRSVARRPVECAQTERSRSLRSLAVTTTAS